ncbi:MAG: hypothetical protein WCP28_20605, partial [Actinomycetes bacterium]
EYYSPSADNAWRTAIGRFAYANQAIAFAQPPNTAISTSPVTLSATGGGSGNPVTFASTTPAVCTSGGANGASVTLVALGACTIDANQAGNGSYNPAPQVQRTFQVTAAAQKPVNRCVTAPVQIPRRGIRRLEAPRCATNAGQSVQVAVTGRLRGDQRYWKVIRKANGAVFIKTYGYRLKLRVTWSAPAVGNFAAYLLTRTYRT